MLCIKTDLEDKNWLIYILEEFRSINHANFEIVVTNIDDRRNFEDTLYYTRDARFKNTLINKSDIPPEGKTKKISSDIFIIDNTDTQDTRFLSNYDLLWNAFVFLSRIEEYLSENSGRAINSYSSNHPRIDKTTFFTPIVNNIFDRLEKIIKENFPGLTFNNGTSPILELSHDVDYIEKTPQLRIKQTASSILEALKNLFKPGRFIDISSKTMKYLFLNASYWCFDYWQELEKKFNQRSVFYIYANPGVKKNLKTWLLDPSYDLVKNDKLKKKLKLLLTEGVEIGLHGSFSSATDKELLRKEKQSLERAIDQEVVKTRQHWLRYVENTTPYIHNELFKFDSTLGWNDIMGFRGGCASRYRPYDHKNKRAFDFFETPQILMDSNILSQSFCDIRKIDEAVTLIEKLRQSKNTHVSISWHLRGNSPDYGWNSTYEKILTKHYSL